MEDNRSSIQNKFIIQRPCIQCVVFQYHIWQGQINIAFSSAETEVIVAVAFFQIIARRQPLLLLLLNFQFH